VTEPGDAEAERPLAPYDIFGGAPFFEALVAAFYSRVATDDILRPMYPSDLDAAERRLRLFLMQYWGGPTTYDDERGHPRLRMRHAPFPIDGAARDRWLSLMYQSLSEQDLPAEQESVIWNYMVGAAFAMQNIEDEPHSPTIPVTEVKP